MDIDEVPPVLQPWCRVHPGYLDDLTLAWRKVRSGHPLVGLTIEIVLEGSVFGFSRFDGLLTFLWGLWRLACWEHHLGIGDW